MVKAMVLDAHADAFPVTSQTKEILEHHFKTIYFKLVDLNIQHCISCSSCGHRTPGVCVIHDDMEPIMRAIAQSDIMIMFTPVWFGGYPSTLKKAVDRFMPMGLPLYKVEKGHLLHPMRYPKKCLIGIGTLPEPDTVQETCFKALIDQNGLNYQLKTVSLVVHRSDDAAVIEENITGVIKKAFAI